MYADNTLTPKEATRLCALGCLALEPMPYSALAMAIRHFVSRILGPSLDVTGTSVELLKYEGLIESVNDGADAPLMITESGREELRMLLMANIRVGASELNKLILTLKFQLLHLLDPAEQLQQADIIIEAADSELARLLDLRQHHAGDGGHLLEWLDHDIDQLEARLLWLRGFKDRLNTGQT